MKIILKSTIFFLFCLAFFVSIPGIKNIEVANAQSTCGDPTNPRGSIISNGALTSASGGSGSQYVVDGIFDANYWNSGWYPPQWIQIDLGQTQDVSGLKLYVAQYPSPLLTTHQILTGPTANPTNVQRTLNCDTYAGQVINVVFNPVLPNTRYIRINTTYGDSWVAWTEIRVYGSSPGAQAINPGIIFSGNGQYNFGKGQASERNWVVGGSVYPEVFPTSSIPSTTSYQYLLDKTTNARIPITNLTTVSGCSDLNNCTLPSSPPLPNGVYHANTNLRLNTYTFPPNKNYVFLVNGDLTVLGGLVVPNGSTAFFSSSRDIIIDRNVGTTTNMFPLPSGQLQGYFSADRDFIIDAKNDCIDGADKMLNVEGSIITNAYGNGGKFRNTRDLCGNNPAMPALTIRLRLDFLLNTPILLMKQKTTLREDAP